jgi:hypothetical protein
MVGMRDAQPSVKAAALGAAARAGLLGPEVRDQIWNEVGHAVLDGEPATVLTLLERYAPRTRLPGGLTAYGLLAAHDPGRVLALHRNRCRETPSATNGSGCHPGHLHRPGDGPGRISTSLLDWRVTGTAASRGSRKDVAKNVENGLAAPSQG